MLSIHLVSLFTVAKWVPAKGTPSITKEFSKKKKLNSMVL